MKQIRNSEVKRIASKLKLFSMHLRSHQTIAVDTFQQDEARPHSPVALRII